MKIDYSEVAAFAAHLGEAGAATKKETRAVVERGANNVKRSMRADMSASKHFGQIAPTINYTVREVGAFGGGLVEAEVGPDNRRRAARLALFPYFGGANGGGGTVRDPLEALLDEMPGFERAVADLAERHL